MKRIVVERVLAVCLDFNRSRYESVRCTLSIHPNLVSDLGSVSPLRLRATPAYSSLLLITLAHVLLSLGPISRTPLSILELPFLRSTQCGIRFPPEPQFLLLWSLSACTHIRCTVIFMNPTEDLGINMKTALFELLFLY